MKSMIVLEIKCPQLSKPEATAARNQKHYTFYPIDFIHTHSNAGVQKHKLMWSRFTFHIFPNRTLSQIRINEYQLRPIKDCCITAWAKIKNKLYRVHFGFIIISYMLNLCF